MASSQTPMFSRQRCGDRLFDLAPGRVSRLRQHRDGHDHAVVMAKSAPHLRVVAKVNRGPDPLLLDTARRNLEETCGVDARDLPLDRRTTPAIATAEVIPKPAVDRRARCAKERKAPF